MVCICFFLVFLIWLCICLICFVIAYGLLFCDVVLLCLLYLINSVAGVGYSYWCGLLIILSFLMFCVCCFVCLLIVVSLLSCGFNIHCSWFNLLVLGLFLLCLFVVVVCGDLVYSLLFDRFVFVLYLVCLMECCASL